jgi:hypothetical protein
MYNNVKKRELRRFWLRSRNCNGRGDVKIKLKLNKKDDSR